MKRTAKEGTTKKEPSRFCGKKGRSGPPKGNANNMRHGLRGSKLPKDCKYIENAVNNLRRQVEAALVSLKGEISIVDAAAVNTVLKWEKHGLLCSRWLTKEAGSMTPADRLKFSAEIAKASDSRDRAIRSLGLDQSNDASPWATPHKSLTVDEPAGGDV